MQQQTSIKYRSSEWYDLRLCRGSDEDWGEVLDASRSRLQLLAWRLVGCDESEDLAAEAEMRVYRARQGFQGGYGGYLAFSRRIVENVCLDWLRKRNRQQKVFTEGSGSEEWQEYLANQPDRGSDQHRDYEVMKIHDGISRLPQIDQEIVLLKASGFTATEIGIELGTSEENVNTRYHRALKKLRTYLEVGVLARKSTDA